MTKANRKAQMVKGLAEMALLRILQARPHYGLELLDALRERAGLNVSDGTIYPILYRLEQAGEVMAEWEVGKESKRPRKYYALTDRGHAQLEIMIEQWRGIHAQLNNLIDGENNDR